MLLDTYFINLMILYGNYMNNAGLKWRHLFFLYILSCFDPQFVHISTNISSSYSIFLDGFHINKSTMIDT
jgi:hypothetical protein